MFTTESTFETSYPRKRKLHRARIEERETIKIIEGKLPIYFIVHSKTENDHDLLDKWKSVRIVGYRNTHVLQVSM